jgi:putative ABC transport system permease protein
VVAAVLPAATLEGRVGIIDIATAQWRFDRLGKLSRIDLKLQPGANPEKVRSDLREILPAGARVVDPVDAASDAARLSRAYRSNLSALALVALFTGGFFVYSTQSLATLRRRREFALLHALGVTRAEQLRLVLGSGVLLGLLGAALGVLAGFFIARAGLSVLGGDPARYLRGSVLQVNLHLVEIVIFFVLGVTVAAIGTLQPAIDAARIPTAAALKASDLADAAVRSQRGLVIALLVAAGAVLWLPPLDGLPLPGYVSIALLIVAVVAAMPSLLQRLLAVAPQLRATPWEMAMAHLRGTARHATLSVSAIVVSFSLMVAMAIMVTSFRQSLDAWTQRLLPADLYLRAGYVGQSAHFDPAAIADLRSIQGIARLEVSRFAQMTIATMPQPVTLIARDLDAQHAERALWLESSDAKPVSNDALPLWISQAVADAADLHAGSEIRVTIAGRTLAARVRGVWRDYEHPGGAVVMERDRYVALTGDEAVNTAWLWLNSDGRQATVQRHIRERLPADIDYDMRTPGDLRRLSLLAFDRTFAVTYALELVAIIIGLFGIAAGTSAQVLARRREIGVLRHLGLTRAQVAAMLAIEGAGLGALGVLVGLLTGGLVSLILIRVVNRQSFHWSMDLAIPSGVLVVLSAALIAAAALIAVVSGRSAMRGDVIAAVKEDW